MIKRLAFFVVLLFPIVALAETVAVDPGVPIPWWAQLLIGVAGAVGTGLAWAGKLLTDWLRESKKNSILQRATELALRIVHDLNASEVEALKKAAADGKLTSAEKADLKRAAIQSLKSWLGPKGAKALLWAVGSSNESLDDVLSAVVEHAVALSKG